jgi:tryptophanyl-tRNA synthetase
LITDERDEIHAKLKSALTDSMQGVSYGRELRPGVSNLIDLICYLDESISATPEEVAYDLKDLSMRALKEKAADTVDLALRDVRDRYKWIMGQGDGYLAEIEAKASEKARTMANKKMSMVKKAMGMD